MKEVRIKIESTCDQCQGSKKMVVYHDLVDCSACDGTGFQEEYWILEVLKKELEKL